MKEIMLNKGHVALVDDDDFIKTIDARRELIVPNSEYVSWLEEKVITLLNK